MFHSCRDHHSVCDIRADAIKLQKTSCVFNFQLSTLSLSTIYNHPHTYELSAVHVPRQRMKVLTCILLLSISRKCWSFIVNSRSLPSTFSLKYHNPRRPSQNDSTMARVTMTCSVVMLYPSLALADNVSHVIERMGDNPMQIFTDTVMASRNQLLAAGIARGVSISASFPIDTIKTRTQMGKQNPLELKGLFNGIEGSLVGQIPYGVLTFGSYEIYKRIFLNWFPDQNVVLVYVLSAVLGDITGSGWLCPSEVVKQQVQGNIYPGTNEAIQGIWKKKGLGGFYQGYVSAISRDVPFRAIQLTTFELTKHIYALYNSREIMNLDPLEAAVCGAIAGSLAAAITAPLDRTKTLFMTRDDSESERNVYSCLVNIYNREGLGGLFKGILPRVGYIAPNASVFFIVYESIQKYLLNHPIS